MDAGQQARIAIAVHALTGRWYSGDRLAEQIGQAGSREELLALGIMDLHWIDGHDEASLSFRRIVRAAAINPPPLGEALPPRTEANAAFPAKELNQIAEKFAEAPTASDPRDMLKHLGAGLHAGASK